MRKSKRQRENGRKIKIKEDTEKRTCSSTGKLSPSLLFLYPSSHHGTVLGIVWTSMIATVGILML